MIYSDPRQCWRCGECHVGQCPRRQPWTEQTRRLNDFLEDYVSRIGGTDKARRVLEMRER